MSLKKNSLQNLCKQLQTIVVTDCCSGKLLAREEL